MQEIQRKEKCIENLVEVQGEENKKKSSAIKRRKEATSC